MAGSQMAANKLIDSYELCKIGRLGQHELSFLTVFIMIGCFIFFLQIDRRLIKHGWEIKRALSEPVSLTSTAIDSNQQAMPSTGGHAVEHRVLAPSVSRLIAMAGLIMLILFYFGYGIISLYHFGRTCKMPGDIDGVTKFLYAGLTFFAPYVATRFSEAFTRKERILSVPSRAGASSDNSLATSVRQEGDRSHPPRSLSSADSDHPPAS